MSWAEAKWIRDRIGSKIIITTDKWLYGQEITIYRGSENIGSATIDSLGKATFVTEESGILTFTGTGTNGYQVLQTIDIDFYGTHYITLEAEQKELYEFRINANDSDPTSCIEYLNNTASYTAAYMDYDAGSFNYGSWANAFFIKQCRPCMVKYDGTVDYYLNPDDYSLKDDGTASDITNISYEGNVMIAIPKCYVYVRDGGDGYTYHSIANYKVDDNYHCYAHINANGDEIDCAYMSAYLCYNTNSIARSVSGKAPTLISYNPQIYTTANNTKGAVDNVWYSELLVDRLLINELLLLIGKSTDTQTVFGKGYKTFQSYDSTVDLYNGTMNMKGLFWGANSSGGGVKVFGIENYWGIPQNYIGWIAGISNGKNKVKLTYGTKDGSTTSGWGSSGYITIPYMNNYETYTSSYGGYIQTMQIVCGYGLLPSALNGSSTTYYCDQVLLRQKSSENSKTITYSIGGTYYMRGEIYSTASGYYYFANALSCKPINK